VAQTEQEVRGLLAVLDGHLTGPVNVGNPGEVTMRELAELVIELTKSSSEMITVQMPDEREGDPLQRQPDITLVNSTYGWAPNVSLREGLGLMIDHFRAHESF
jgi:UDP-glucuronate decarboxylase